MNERLRAIEQREHAVGVDRVERIGQPDVVDAGVGEDLGLAELRAADADGAARDLHAREVRRSCASWRAAAGARPRASAAACMRSTLRSTRDCR